MDDRRFDNAVRALARHRSRRGLLGGLIGGGVALLASHLRLPGATAQSSYVPQGGWCSDDDQCDPWLDCLWNGFGSAGATCCAGVGGSCDDDFGCCGTPSCYGGTCTDFASAPVHGEPCDPNGNACVYASGGFSCGYVSETGDFRCCADPGGRCGGSGECCGDNFCGDDGLCRPMSPTGSQLGGWCGPTYCAPGSECCNPSCGICVPGQGACIDDECYACPGCDSGLCLPNGYCFS